MLAVRDLEYTSTTPLGALRIDEGSKFFCIVADGTGLRVYRYLRPTYRLQKTSSGTIEVDLSSALIDVYGMASVRIARLSVSSGESALRFSPIGPWPSSQFRGDARAASKILNVLRARWEPESRLT